MANRIPAELTKLRQWVYWKKTADGKKLPFSPKTGKQASTTDSATWGTYEEALSAEDKDGVGFVFTAEDGYCGIDLDHCLSEDGPERWADYIVTLIDSYTEVSPGGSGLHIIVKGKLPPGGRRRKSFEIYDSGRYFTITGDVYQEKSQIHERPEQIVQLHSKVFGHSGETTTTTESKLSEEEIREVLNTALHAENGLKFAKLWNGDIEGYASHSEADVALCSILAFWVGKDPAKVDQLFRRSKLMRDKWNRDDYRTRTLELALKTETRQSKEGGLLSETADDEGNAQCVKKLYGDRILYTDAYGWMHYGHGRWNWETGGQRVDRLVVRTLKQRRAAAASATEDFESVVKAAKPTASHVRSCKTLLESLVIANAAEFDSELDMLNCANGVLNLRTGEVTPHSNEQRFTYCLDVEFNKDADSSFWNSWLLEAVGGDKEVLKFLQLALGYSLTGQTREEILFYIWGPPRGGKGVFTETLIALLGGEPLAVEMDIAAFTEQRQAGSQNFDLAGLKAARFVAASESKENQWLDGAKLKRWTGGNLVRCAHKYKGMFSYRPQFKIWLTSNFTLQVDPDDVAAWTRPQVIEFPNSWLGKEDKTLKQRMKEPGILEGILVWAVRGAMEWYKLPKGGLRAPASIVAATQAARGRVDWVERWVKEELEVTRDPSDVLTPDVYYGRYELWAKESGTPVKKLLALNKTLDRLLGSAGCRFEQREVSGTLKWCFVGVRFRRGSFVDAASRLAQEIEHDSLAD